MKKQTRREFLAESGAVGLSLASSVLAHTNTDGSGLASPPQHHLDDGLAELRASFSAPPFSARPMTRWWWFGGAVTPEEITRQLSMMRDAGLRGVELQPVYPVEVDDPSRKIRNVRYFSTEWFELLQHTVNETSRLGLQLDFTLGSGWPYGGPFIPAELAARKLSVITRDVVGPGDFSWDLGTVFPDEAKIVRSMAVPLLSSGELDLSHASAISHDPTLPWRVPAGNWKLMVFADCPTLMQVKRATPGMEGYVLDHFNRAALDLLLDAVGARTLHELQSHGSPPFHSIFCDSLEVEGADWTPDLLREFHERRGYDLAPCLPALFQDAGALTPHIRYDYHLTLSELILANFFRPLAAWSEQHGVTARVQAHGAMGDVMQAYGTAHIPEGEHIHGGDEYRVDIAHRRLASSAAHIYGKRIVSAETYTWLRAPLFCVTLEMMKAATDAQFLDGINQIVNHGYPYSPPQAGQPGWTFYASTVVNHNNVWWRHYSHLTGYIQRAAGVLVQGSAINRVAVYLPLADVYAKFGAGGLHIDEEMERHLGTRLVLALRRAGYDFDFINDDALQRIAKVENARLVAGTASYSAVILPEARYIPPESIERLAEFVAGGGFLTFISVAPEIAPGVADQKTRTERVRETWERMRGNAVRKQGEARLQTSGKGYIYRAADIPDAIAHLPERVSPDFQILEAGDNSEPARRVAIENVGFVHRRTGDVDFYFVSNISSHMQDLRVRFAVGHRTPERWNPETGKVEETLCFGHVKLPERDERATEVQFSLDPFESCFIVFPPSGTPPAVTRTNWPGPLQIRKSGEETQVTGWLAQNGTYHLAGVSGEMHRFSVHDVPDAVSIPGPWRLTLPGLPALSLERLVSWTELSEARNYSGWGEYETYFDMAGPMEGVDWLLDLGVVKETADVTLNGVSLGAAWKGSRKLSCRDALKSGRNHLKIEVGNLWINKVQSLPPRDLKALAETFGIRWGRDQEKLRSPLLPSGLLGPVRLVARRHRTEKFRSA